MKRIIGVYIKWIIASSPFQTYFSMNAGVGLISFPNYTVSENELDYQNGSAISNQIINLVKADSSGSENDFLSCPWVEIGQEAILSAYQEVTVPPSHLNTIANIFDGFIKIIKDTFTPIEILFLKINDMTVFQYRIFSMQHKLKVYFSQLFTKGMAQTVWERSNGSLYSLLIHFIGNRFLKGKKAKNNLREEIWNHQ